MSLPTITVDDVLMHDDRLNDDAPGEPSAAPGEPSSSDEEASEESEEPIINVDLRVNLEPWTRYPYKRLILSDLEKQPAPDSNCIEKQAKLYQNYLDNAKLLCDSGAAGPFFGISGFDMNNCISFMKFGKDIEYGLVYWGSPHWGTIEFQQEAKAWKSSSQFKSNAFESMSWGSPHGMVAMTYKDDYKVELWSPTYRDPRYRSKPDPRSPRSLIVAPCYTREYVPLMSGDHYNEISEGTGITVALLVPGALRECVTYLSNDTTIDIGMTMLKTLEVIQCRDEQFAIELGGQTFSLSKEIHLARMSRDSWAA